eukprot:scaffold3086_cov75-Cylindrotheca_fusiformis.AAC.9
MTLLKRNNNNHKRDSRPLLFPETTHALSDTYEEEDDFNNDDQQKKSWKLFSSNKKKKGNNNNNSSSSEDNPEDAWESIPIFPIVSSSLGPSLHGRLDEEEEEELHQRQLFQIPDNPDTVQSLSAASKERVMVGALSSSSASPTTTTATSVPPPVMMMSTVTNEDQQPSQILQVVDNTTTTATATATPPKPIPTKTRPSPPSSSSTRKKEKVRDRLPPASTILARPFGRETILKDCRWFVQVGIAEWSNDMWKYRVTIQQRQPLLQPQQQQQPPRQKLSPNEKGYNNTTATVTTSSFMSATTAAAVTVRSLKDFAWLEQALQLEFQGGLLLPSLNITLGIPDLNTCQHDVDSKLLAHWLSDVLDGIRGDGELLLKQQDDDDDEDEDEQQHRLHSPNDNDDDGIIGAIVAASGNVMDSEAMEAFLYRTELGDVVDEYSHMEHQPKTSSSKAPQPSPQLSKENEVEVESSVWDWIRVPEICGGPSYAPTTTTTTTTTTTVQPSTSTTHNTTSGSSSSGGTSPALETRKNLFGGGSNNRDHVSSKALGDFKTFQMKNSFVESSSSPMGDDDDDGHNSSNSVAQYYPLIRAERDLVWMWRKRALGAMELLRRLKEQEKSVGAAWKRFAITISNLFSFEKELESTRIDSSSSYSNSRTGTTASSSKRQKDHSKLQNPYRKLQKSAVDDCLRILTKAKSERSIPGLDTLERMLQTYIADLSAVHPSVEAYLEGLYNVSMIDHEQKEQQQEEKKTPEAQHNHVVVVVQKFLANEALLQRNLTTLCQTAPLRTSRMAHKYFEQEYRQSNTIQASAETMKSKINVATKEGLAKLIHRHLLEEKEDRMTEIALVQRMVGIGSSKKFVPPSAASDQSTQEVLELSKHMDEETEEEAAKSVKRDNALGLCRERIGRWDAKLSMAIMDAAGVSDANVRVEETTRELRIVRKYAIGLREQLQRCIEALEYLQFCVNGQDDTNMRNLRQNFLTELQAIFSATYLSTDENRSMELPVDVLRKHGIHLKDPSGWLQRSVGSCGGNLATYLKAREAGSEWLLNSLGDLLKDYTQRVEAVESFVYMECVGIQLEKHFSQARATALAAFEKKTDITSAINIATRKRMPQLVKDLQAKLETVGPDVSHTTVKEAKEAHLESKALKQELSELGMRRLTRTRETSTERVIALMTVWSREEEGSSAAESKALKMLMQSLEQRVREKDLIAYLDASPAVST